MQDSRFALAPVSVPVRPAEHRADPADPPRSLVGAGFGVAGALVVGAILAGLPLLSICIFAAGGFAATVMAAASRLRSAGWEVASLEGTAPPTAQDVYRDILRAFADVQRALAASPRVGASIAPVLERSRAAVQLCGRMAQLGRTLQRYLEAHDPALIRAELDRLRACVAAAADARAVSAWAHATAARARQLATCEQLRELNDRVLARLELVRATLESFAVAIVRLEAVDEEQALLAGESVVEHLDEVDAELEALAAALAGDLAR